MPPSRQRPQQHAAGFSYARNTAQGNTFRYIQGVAGTGYARHARDVGDVQAELAEVCDVISRLPFDGDWPVTQGFGEHPAWYARYGLAGHNGLDFGLPDGTPVLAPIDGEVWEAEYDPPGYGFYVKLRSARGEDVVLAHLHLWHIARPGEWLAAGALVGYSDNTGNSTGPHLHLGYRPDATVRTGPYNGFDDPLKYLGPRPAVDGTYTPRQLP